ncbi:DNA polymerase III subunit chi [Grimontia hollisae]|uniref:DNA polymerase III chi subunit n=2 Tax=Grimontia hollisae TaxID=673 RepID=D0I889_GRIHO|nr:DNA polymerase III subunit chi [Grimontia hollisae]AMG31019.1 DNA polymerase III subunit chi [Grimontia hollisae]EEY72858.1 DNA polymerase III chi subunit [Grimontia hollisae CIP 101886]MDF2186631.1 DNA polymerase III subunit chi [Grimontia hollisae]STO46876.1 DNA polymerase III subunit chi [Grimontia hollisae]STO56218.1 DNA polymerase III subunit chi [Grimontia hollisae]
MTGMATFYLLDESHNNPSLRMLEKVCQLSALFCQQGMKVFITAADKPQAEAIDEALWQQPAEGFVPHNLVGEGPRGGAQVEIGWPGVRHSGHRHVLINLAQEAATFAPSFAQVVDFVPCEDALKQQARERYKIYRMAGRQMRTLAIEEMSH